MRAQAFGEAEAEFQSSGCFEGNECTPAIEEDSAESHNSECDERE